MTKTFTRDDNFVPITGLGIIESKQITYDSDTTGAINTTDLFTITGTVALRIFAVCSDDLDSDGAATIGVGIAGSTAGLIAQTTATTITAGTTWLDDTPDELKSLPNITIINDQTIIQTIADETIKSGTLTYYCLWYPVSPDGNVEVV